MNYFLPAIFILLLFSCNEPGKNSSAEDSLPVQKPQQPSPAGSLSKLSYTIIKERSAVPLTVDSLKTVVDNWLARETFHIDSLVDFAQELTAHQLSFTTERTPSDPNKAAKKGEANCIGYAALFNAIVSYALEKKELEEEYECHQYVGKISYDGQDVHAFFNDPFFADHDFNVVKKRDGSLTIAVDPSLFEYLGVRRVLPAGK